MSKYGKLVAGLIVAWLGWSIYAGARELYAGGVGKLQLPLFLGLAVVAPIVLFAIWYVLSRGFREFVLGLNPEAVTLVHSWRVAGFSFVAMAAYGILPKGFALPAGFGDMAIGLTAWFVAFRLANRGNRGWFLVWQGLGILDLVVAVGTGMLARVVDPAGVSTAAMTCLPMSLIPTFAVPLLMILHLISFAQRDRLPERTALLVGVPVV